MGDELLIIVWNVEHGSAIYARTPNGRHILLDAGRSDTFSPAIHLRERYPPSRPELFVLSHAHADHIRDIENIGALGPQVFLCNPSVPQELICGSHLPQSGPLQAYLEFAKEYSCSLADDSPLRPTQPANWGGVEISAFYNCYPSFQSDNLNNYSVVTVLRYGNMVFLFPGDLEAPGWEGLLEYDGFRQACTHGASNSDEDRILVAPHHGRRAGVHEPFLRLYQPHLTIMSDVYGNETTDYNTYCRWSAGMFVDDERNPQRKTCQVVTTKTHDFVRIVASSESTDIYARSRNSSS